MPVHPLPARPQLSPRPSWEELARAYGTIAAALYDRLPELETDLEEFRAAATRNPARPLTEMTHCPAS
jgi:hypothetical protein